MYKYLYHRGRFGHHYFTSSENAPTCTYTYVHTSKGSLRTLQCVHVFEHIYYIYIHSYIHVTQVSFRTHQFQLKRKRTDPQLARCVCERERERERDLTRAQTHKQPYIHACKRIHTHLNIYTHTQAHTHTDMRARTHDTQVHVHICKL